MRTIRRISRSDRLRPPGGVYVAVLGISALVFVLGVGGLASARAIARAQAEARDVSGARWGALSGIELGRYAIESNPHWRSQRSEGEWFADARIGDAFVTLTAVNPSGAFNRYPTDPVRLTASARQGECLHVATLTLDANVTPYSCMEIPLTAGGAISATGATVHASGYTIATNNAFTALLCSINANVEASLTAVGVTVSGTVRSLVPARSLPGSDAFDYYIANGTVISGNSLTSRSGARVVSNALLTPTVNTLTGATNAQGIYVLDAGAQKIAIGDCRIVGTLVILNANGPVVFESRIVAEPAVANFPCFMVQGAATIGFSSAVLTEGGSVPNLNPTGSPYPWSGGVVNATPSDSYQSAINGLVYVSGAATVSGSPVVNQLIVGGSVNLGGTLTLGYTSECRRDPPPGFSVVRMRPRTGDRRQVIP